MSRIGKQLIEVPAGVEVRLEQAPLATVVHVKGPLGSLSRSFSTDIAITLEDKIVKLLPKDDSLFLNALWGTYASHIVNMIEGVTKGFLKKLQIEGIGYKADAVGANLVMALGFSHPVKLPIPQGLKVSVEKGLMTISGTDKELVGQYAATVIHYKKPEPYKGKGIRYENQVIRRKQGKKSVA